MQYRIQEASFELPDELHDQSVNVFTSSRSGPSPFNVIVTRDRVESGTDLGSHVTKELQLLERTLIDFRTTYRLEHRVDGRAVEVTGATFTSGDETIQQRQVFMIEDARSLTITASAPRDFSPDQLEALNRLIQTFRFES